MYGQVGESVGQRDQWDKSSVAKNKKERIAFHDIISIALGYPMVRHIGEVGGPN